MNNKGQIGSVLMVFGALILVVIALLAMLSFKEGVDNSRIQLKSLSESAIAKHNYLKNDFNSLVLESIESSKESNNFENSFNESLKELAEAKRSSNQNNNFYAKLALGDYSLSFENGNFRIIIFELFEDYSVKNNELRYNYSFNILFNKEGILEEDL